MRSEQARSAVGREHLGGRRIERDDRRHRVVTRRQIDDERDDGLVAAVQPVEDPDRDHASPVRGLDVAVAEDLHASNLTGLVPSLAVITTTGWQESPRRRQTATSDPASSSAAISSPRPPGSVEALTAAQPLCLVGATR